MFARVPCAFQSVPVRLEACQVCRAAPAISASRRPHDTPLSRPSQPSQTLVSLIFFGVSGRGVPTAAYLPAKHFSLSTFLSPRRAYFQACQTNVCKGFGTFASVPGGASRTLEKACLDQCLRGLARLYASQKATPKQANGPERGEGCGDWFWKAG